MSMIRHPYRTLFVITTAFCVLSCAEIIRIGQEIVDTIEPTPTPVFTPTATPTFTPTITPTPVVAPTVTPIPTPTFSPTATPVSDLRELTVKNAQLDFAIAWMNTLIDTCNTYPELCTKADTVIRINSILTSLDITNQYLEFLQEE
jgi:hypothetical protein